ncbi:MAG: aminodeoxychorismate/anthranilate synthase component II [Flavobacteriaceae bacterium]|nr:aminodeoxychorismate/anthranilate synthase component II [Flavobacteriaceae bacterium]MBQ22574.1 aminodeoxychorismate/anthranilate synthase component II [Flavobacteriales bacterium]|tara:strand:+ start:3762 stop:4328 length:567 start_codon:yes stop_codon:yes gene_type:complete
MNKVFVIDNYDSFTYNLVHYLKDFNVNVKVCRNDKFDINDLLNYNKILLSPGPGIPDEAGKLKEVIRTYANTKSILGICLGHQAIGEVFGGNLKNLEKVYHGVSSKIEIVKNDYIYDKLPKEITVGRYHSWIIENPLPKDLIATAYDSNNHIMSFKHKEFDVKGLQFHPESILTPDGKQIINNWLNFK